MTLKELYCKSCHSLKDIKEFGVVNKNIYNHRRAYHCRKCICYGQRKRYRKRYKRHEDGQDFIIVYGDEIYM